MTVVSSSRLLSGIAVLALASPAFAQDAATPAATYDPSAAAVAAAAAATAPTRELPKTLPTTGDGAVITGVLSDFCLPTINGADVEKTAKKLKYKLDKKTGEYVLPMGEKPYQVSILPPGGANPTVCQLTVRYAIGTDQTILDAVNIWRYLHQPMMVLRRNDAAVYPGGLVRITTTWDNYARQMLDGKLYGVAVAQIDQQNGSPSTNGSYDEAVIVYNQRPPVEPTVENAGEILQQQQREFEAQQAAEAQAAAQAAAQAPMTEAPAAAPPVTEPAPAPATAPAQ